jgi:hypothetical protein
VQVVVIRSNSSARGKFIASDRRTRLVMTANALGYQIEERLRMGRALA